MRIRTEEKRKLAFIYLFLSNEFCVCLYLFGCLFVCFFYQCSHFPVLLRCSRWLYLCVSVDCVVYRKKLYITNFNGGFNCSAFTAPRKYLTIKFYTQQFIIKSNHQTPTTKFTVCSTRQGWQAGKQLSRLLRYWLSCTLM